MPRFWMNMEEGESQRRHNIHILDNSILSKLYKLETTAHDESHPPINSPSGSGLQVSRRFVSNEKDRTRLFESVLGMCMQGDNVLVIPEAVLREFYHRTELPFTRDSDHQWIWAYQSIDQIERKQDALKTPWDDRGLLLSRVIQDAFQQGAVSICDSPEAFAAQFSRPHPGKRLVIVGDDATCGDSAIRAIADAINPLHFRAISVLSGDTELRASLQSILQDYTGCDTATVLDAYAKYVQSYPEAPSSNWTRESLNVLFLKASHTHEDFEGYRINARSGMRSDALLKALGYHDAIRPESGLGRA